MNDDNSHNPLDPEARPSTAQRLDRDHHDAASTDDAPIDTTLVETTALEPLDSHPDSLTQEQHIRAHLQDDVESSFVPPLSPIQDSAISAEPGADDTFVFDASPTKKPPPQPEAQASEAPPPDTSLNAPADDSGAHTPPSEPAHPPSAEQDNAASTATDPDLTWSLENMSSSPAAAAAARTVSRVVSSAKNAPPTSAPTSAPTPGPTSAPTSAPSDHTGRGSAAVPSAGDAHDSSSFNPPSNRDSSIFDGSNDASFSAGAPTLRHYSSDFDMLKAGANPSNSIRINKRPKYLRSKNASQRSSTSSFLSNDDVDIESDLTVAAGPVPAPAPAFGLTRSISNTLSRSLSMGSVASGFDDYADLGRPEPLEPLEEIEPVRSNPPADHLTTPKAKKGPLLAPTDTVIARHVRNVEVPESLANEYKTKGGLTTPIQPHRKVSDFTPGPGTVTSTSTGTLGRHGKNMTLKEQHSTIERLSKENFDLKLKVMFLSDRLDKLSEEGVKEMISENVDLKTSLAVIQRDNKILRRRVKDLEKRLRDRDEEDRPSTARSGYSSDDRATSVYDERAQEREEELIHLRERIEEHVTEIEKLRAENMSNHYEKRKLAETLKSYSDKASDRAGDSLGRQDEADVWKDLLEQETARREQADEDNRRLREEIFRLKQDSGAASATGPPSAAGPGGLHHTTNIYNITRKARPHSPSRSRPVSGMSGDVDHANSLSQSSTLVDDLRRESEELRHENAELRREVGAQTSMLTSRNREKERLYQEIEDLKLAQRRGGAPSTVDSLLDRSASRAGNHERSTSRASGGSRLTMTAEDPDREELENKLAESRDKINELHLAKQELQREAEAWSQDYEAADLAKREAEDAVGALQEDIETAMNDLVALQSERDQALQDQETLEIEFESLRKEAQEEIDALETDNDLKNDEIKRLHEDLQDRSENFDALQDEMRQMSEALVRLEDEQENKLRRIEQLEHDLNESNGELEELEAKLCEANDKAQRLGVQQESSQGEIAFLREEQEGDKIRIGDLEAALANTEQGLRDERERARELDERLAKERSESELVATREKEEVQQIINNLNSEATSLRDEVRKLRMNLRKRESEATDWKEKLMELENNLRGALGDLNGTRASLLSSIARLQKELEESTRELDTTKASLLEKDRIIKQRDGLLESHALESRRLAEMLDKERSGHRNTKNQFETFQRTHTHVSRTVTSQDSRINDLEATRASDKKKLAQLENTFKEQLVERNNLLLILWTRLSAVCGTDWAHNNSLINGRALPSLESVSTMLPGFSKNLLSAVKAIESIVSSFQTRVKTIERELWKEYQSLENSLEVRNKKLERLESIVRSGVSSGNVDTQGRIAQLESAYRTLKIENATLQRAQDARTRGAAYYEQSLVKSNSNDALDGSPAPAVPMGPMYRETPLSKIPRSKTSHLEAAASSLKSRTTTMTRSFSSSGNANASLERTGSSSGADNQQPPSTPNSQGPGSGPEDKRWMLRLRELESKLKQEREARNSDRAAARQRIQDSERQNSELVTELARAKRRGPGAGMAMSGGGDGS